MGADGGLIRASLSESLSRANASVLNKKALYDSTATNMETVFNSIDSAMKVYSNKKKANRNGVRKQMAAFETQANSGVKEMYSEDEPMPEVFMNAFRKKITDLQDEFELHNTYGKGDTAENSHARARIMGELQRVTNRAKGFRANTNIFLNSIDNINEGEVNAKDIAGSQQALDFKNYDRLVREGKISKVEYGENGIEITSKGYYSDASGSWGEEVVSLASLKAKFPQTNTEHHTNLLATQNRYLDQSKIAATQPNPENDYDEEIGNAVFTRQVDTPENFRNVVSSVVPGVTALPFKVYLEKNLDISINVLDNMYYTEGGVKVAVGEVFKELDVSGANGVPDGRIDGNDLLAKENDWDYKFDAEGKKVYENLTAFESNIDALIDALTNVDNPAFDMTLSSEMLGSYIGGAVKSNVKEMYDKTFKANNPSSKTELLPLSDGENYLVYGGGSRKGRQIKDAYNLYDAKQRFRSYDDKFTFKPTDKGWTVTGPTDPEKDGSYSGPITTRLQDEADLVLKMGFNRQATRLGFKGFNDDNKPAIVPFKPINLDFS